MEFKCKQCGKCCNQFEQDNSGGIMIFEWEKQRLENIAKKKNIKFKIEPGQTDYDSKSNTQIITTYAFKAKSCPFLKNKKCSIHANRPLYCKAYPLLVTISKNKFNLKLLSCPNTILPKPKAKESPATSYYNIYGNMFLCALELEIFRHYYLNTLNNLENNNLIKITPNKQKAKTLTFFNFLIKNKLISKQEVNKSIKNITNFSNARAIIKQTN